jgi:hypothetical protein
MGKGQEYLHRLHEVLGDFEKAIVRREHRKPLLDDRVVLQQEVDDARQRVVDTMIELLREAQEEYLSQQ